VDPSKVNLKSIGDEVRYRIFDYVRSKGVTSRDLGINPTIINRIKNRRIRVSDRTLAKLLRFLTLEEFAELISGRIPSQLIEPRDLSEALVKLESSINQLKILLDKYPQLSSIAYQKFNEIISHLKHYSITVTNEHIEKFKKILRDKAPKTASDRMRYLLRALRDLNYELSTDKLQEYIIDLKEQSIYVAEHTAKALKLFIKHVIKDRNLYESFKTPRVTEEADKEIPTPNEVRAVAKAINWSPAKAYYCLLAESGLRPGELFKLIISEINIEERTIKPKRVTETKRAYIAFFSKQLQKYLKQVYLPYREEFISKYAKNMKYLIDAKAEEWK